MIKKLLATLLAATMALGLLTGCGSSSSDVSSDSGSSSEDPSTSISSSEDISTNGSSSAADTSKEVELVMYIVSDRPAGQDVVDENLNTLLKEKLNCTLKINWIGWAEYEQKYPLLFSSGEQFDMAYCAIWLGFANLAQRGAFMPLEEMLPTYAPDNYAMQSESALQQATVGGHLYAVPTLLPSYSVYGCIYRGDLAAEAGITDTIDTFEEIEQYCDYIVANHPEMEAIDQYSSGPELLNVWNNMNGINSNSNLPFLFYNPSEEHPTVKAVYDLDGITEFYEKMKEWCDRGYWVKSALSDTDSQKTLNGKAALKFHNIDTWSSYTVQKPDWDFLYGGMNSDVAHLPYTQDCMVISNTSANPERALALWNLLTTDQEVYDAFYYGVLGTTYELNDQGQFTILDTDLYSTSAMWAVRTMDLNLNQAGVPDSYDTIRSGWESTIKEGVGTEKFTGFVLDTSSIATEVAACTNARQQYGWPLELGYTDDVAASIEEYKSALQAAGIDKLIEEFQKQLDAYIESLN